MRQRPEPRTEVTADTRYGAESETALVLLHCQGVTSAMWSPNGAPFGGHPLIAVDTLGEAGRSVRTAPITSPEDRAIRLSDVLDALDAESAHLAGGARTQRRAQPGSHTSRVSRGR
jgi:hypothetical protein